MTIRKRLYISNILMIITPVLLTILTLLLLFFTISKVIGTDFFDQWRENENYGDLIEDIEKLGQQPQDSVEALTQQLNVLYQQRKTPAISMFLYSDKQHLLLSHGPDVTPEVLAEIEGHQRVIMDHTLIQTLQIGSFTLLLVNQRYHLDLDDQLADNKQWLIVLLLGIFLLAILFIILTNYILSRFVFQPINSALDSLVYGVQQIRDGNLSWRISYQGKDEFVSVVDSFNDMALRLQRMVEEQDKQSKNRRELIAGISHDLRTPLTAIKAYVEGLEKGVAQTPLMQQKYLTIISKKTDDLNHLVSQLFLFSKLDIGEFPIQLEPLNIGAFIGTFFNDVREEYAAQGLTIQLTTSSYHSEVLADKLQLRHVFINILENTLKYGNQENNLLELTQYDLNGQIIIEFSDNGPGVSPVDLEKLFEVFYRSDKARSHPERGSGLGLAISKKIIEKHNGEITAGLSATGGLMIKIQLPAMEESDE